MANFFLRPLNVFLTGLLALTFSTAASAQSDMLRGDLNKSFNHFDVVRVNETAAGGTQKRLTFATANKSYELNIEPRDLRSARYAAEDSSADGTRKLEKSSVVNTFRGTISGENNSEVRLTIETDGVEGYFVSNGERYFIEPAANYSKAAKAGESVVYRAEDVTRNINFDCHSDVAERIEDGKKMLAGGTVQNFANFRVMEIATDADYEYVNSVNGNPNAANAKILSVLNMVEGVYKTDLNLTISVVFQHTWSSADPYNGTSIETLLTSFQNYWNANYPAAQYPRDTAHLFSYKPNAIARGYAYLNVICRNQGYAYGVSGRIYVDWNWDEANFLITAHEIAHNMNATHNDTTSCINSLMATQLSGSTEGTFCSASRTEINNFVAADGICLSPRSANVKFDFEGDGKADVAVWRPSTGVWFINQSSGGVNIFGFGQNGDKPVAADYDGDGKTDGAVYRSGNWYRLNSSTNTFDGIGFGLASDVPAPADFDGDGKTDVAVFRPSNGGWYWVNSSNGSIGSASFGANGDVPSPADYDGDGKADINVFRPATGNWYRLNSGNGTFSGVQFGQNGDKAVAADFDGDGKTDISVFRPSNGGWYSLRSADNSISAVGFGANGDVPAAADYDGDGKADISVFRPSSGSWYRLNSANNSFGAVQFGANGDVPAEF